MVMVPSPTGVMVMVMATGPTKVMVMVIVMATGPSTQSALICRVTVPI